MTRPDPAAALVRRSLLLVGLLSSIPVVPAFAHGRDGDRGETTEWSEHRRPQQATARLLVINDAGGPVQLHLDGRSVGSLAPGEARQLRATVGSHRVEATYVQLGVERTLQAVSMRLVRGEHRQVRLLPPRDSLVAVRNPLDRPAELWVDGRFRAALAPFQRQLVAVELGPARLELVIDGRVVDRDQRQVRAFAGVSWSPEPALVGDLVVVNPLPIPVTLTCSRGMVRTLPAHGRTTWTDLDVGVFSLTVRRADGGEPIGVLRPTVRAFERTEATVPAPSRGVVALSNPGRRAVRVYLDGRLLTTLTAGETERLLVRPGVHEVALVSARTGRRLARRSLRVDRYDVARLEAPVASPRGPSLSLEIDEDGAWFDLHAGDAWARVDEAGRGSSSATCAMR
ncbi:MAG: hypothetical protein D6798_01350 [Deltaproteobacteria bacterium]|nr:MAG: hypothetical protein D6798_01350 [Deltaproteobacteria bacterium]